MQFSTATIASAIVLAGVPSLGWAYDSCTWQAGDIGWITVSLRVPSDLVPDPSGLCKGLEDNLRSGCKRDGNHATPSVVDGMLVITFDTSTYLCKAEDINAAGWFASDEDKHGTVHWEW